jgi:hypothetical protein
VEELAAPWLKGRVLEDALALEEVDAAREDDLAVGLQAAGDVRLVEPDDADVAGLVADDGLGAAHAPPHLALAGRPDGDDAGLLLADAQLGDAAQSGEVVVPARIGAEEVAHGLEAEALEAVGGGGPTPRRRGEGVERRSWRGWRRRVVLSLMKDEMRFWWNQSPLKRWSVSPSPYPLPSRERERNPHPALPHEEREFAVGRAGGQPGRAK